MISGFPMVFLFISHLVGGIPTPLKNMSSSIEITIPNIIENKIPINPIMDLANHYWVGIPNIIKKILVNWVCSSHHHPVMITQIHDRPSWDPLGTSDTFAILHTVRVERRIHLLKLGALEDLGRLSHRKTQLENGKIIGKP